MREGDQVQTGQLLATLDPTFAVADVNQLKLQIASLETQVIRDKAELSNSPLAFPDRKEAEFLNYAALQKALYDQRVAQYNAQVVSFDAKISQAKRRCKSCRRTTSDTRSAMTCCRKSRRCARPWPSTAPVLS